MRPLSARFIDAAVAIVVRPGPDPALLLIERTVRPGRRWSGDIAFPGGMREDGDDDLVATARRECREEVGLALSEPVHAARPVWTVRPRGLRPMGVLPVVFRAPDPLALVPEPSEVAAVFWVPLARLRDRGRRRRLWKRFGIVPVPFPMIPVDGRRIWGLTLSMIDRLPADLADSM
jgi:8-oxo-dGTP pyrophosphatase MutT (NUDIX family)